MADNSVRFEQHGRTGHLVLARPEVANAVDLDTARAFARAVDAAADPSIGAVVLRGEGSRFCAGGDVSTFLADDTARYIYELVTTLDTALRRLQAMPKPVVSAVRGAVAGAGVGVMLTGDLIVAGRSTRVTTAYARVGMTPDCGVSWLLPRAVGHQRAVELLLTGRTLGAEEALDWGLVTEIVDDDQVLSRAEELATGLAEGAAGSLGQAVRLTRASWECSRDAHALDEADTIAHAATTPETRALINRFVSR